MDFDEYLKAFSDKAGQKEETALAIYYLEETGKRGYATISDIKDIIRRSRSSILPSSLHTYLHRLGDEEWVTENGSGGQRLTHHGRAQVQALLGDSVLEEYRSDGEVFISADSITDQRYQALIKDINRCYRYRVYDAVMVLSRKLLEDIIFQTLKTHYAGEEVTKFYDNENKRHYTFDELLTNFKDAVADLRMYSRDLDKRMVEGIRELKDFGNRGAHEIRVEYTDEDVDEWSSEATRYVKILLEVLAGASIADGQSS